MALILLKTLKNTLFMIFLQKKSILWQYSGFFVNSPKNVEKHVIYDFFFRKKVYCGNIQGFLFIKPIKSFKYGSVCNFKEKNDTL